MADILCQGGEDRSFAAAAARLAGLAGLLFGWTPDTFWAATPADLATIGAALSGTGGDPADRVLLARLMEELPDE